jgi:hypothetical protein
LDFEVEDAAAAEAEPEAEPEAGQTIKLFFRLNLNRTTYCSHTGKPEGLSQSLAGPGTAA